MECFICNAVNENVVQQKSNEVLLAKIFFYVMLTWSSPEF